jgi:hypothetical protein
VFSKLIESERRNFCDCWQIHEKVPPCIWYCLTNSVYLTLLQRWTNGAVVHGVR